MSKELSLGVTSARFVGGGQMFGLSTREIDLSVELATFIKHVDGIGAERYGD